MFCDSFGMLIQAPQHSVLHLSLIQPEHNEPQYTSVRLLTLLFVLNIFTAPTISLIERFRMALE